MCFAVFGVRAGCARVLGKATSSSLMCVCGLVIGVGFIVAPPCSQELFGDDLDEDTATGDIFDLAQGQVPRGTADAAASSPPPSTPATGSAHAAGDAAPPPADEPRPHVQVPVQEGEGPPPVVVYLPEGRLAYYAHDQRFEATCRIHQARRRDGSFNMCKLTRTSKPSERRSGQGRPLGLAMAWLGAANCHETKESHNDRFWMSTCLGKEERRAARQRLNSVENGRSLFDCERPQRPGEDSEPDVVP